MPCGVHLTKHLILHLTVHLTVHLQVLCNGWGVGTDHYGGYAGEARLQSAWAIPLPAGHIGALELK